jgi:CDP-L-myo-inositol myo-inositolphosphotransferase
VKALLLAAGRGSRLQRSEPKPLTPLLGLTLIERIIFSLQQKGIDEVVVVTGYKSREVAETLKRKLKGKPIKLTFIENPEWERGNGVSTLCAKKILKNEDFLLLMCDHLFEPELLERIPEKNDKCAVCIDKNLSSVFDLEDATKIQIEKGSPKRIGKTLEKYDAVDCGIFYCTPELFQALEKTISEGKYQLSDAIQHLIDRDRIDVIDVSGCFWVDIDTEKSLRFAEKRMLEKLSKPTDGIISRSFNRKISKHITRQLVKTNITPNAVSLIAFLLIVLSSTLFATGIWTYLLIGGILVQLSSILDGCDGEIARLKFEKSRYGGFFDSLLDRYADALVILGLVYGHWRVHGDALIWAVGFLALTGMFAFSYTNARYEAVFEARGLTFRRDLRLFLIALSAIFNQILPVLLILGVLTNLQVIQRVVSFRHAPA